MSNQIVTTFDAIVGALLLGARERSKISIAIMADYCGEYFEQSLISGIEDGYRRCSVSLLDKICRKLSITASQLLTQVEQARSTLKSKGIRIEEAICVGELQGDGQVTLLGKSLIAYAPELFES